MIKVFAWATDDIRGHVIENRNFSKSVRETVEALYPTQEEMDRLLKLDAKRFDDAMRKADLDPSAQAGWY